MVPKMFEPLRFDCIMNIFLTYVTHMRNMVISVTPMSDAILHRLDNMFFNHIVLIFLYFNSSCCEYSLEVPRGDDSSE